MNITKLELINFRNYNKLILKDFNKRNIIIGSNGSGKTSILESIYVGSLTKTFKSPTEDVLINKDSLTFIVKIELSDGNKQKKLEVRLDSTGKKTKINGRLKKKLSDYISVYKVIVFSPDDTRIIKDSPATRRNYINIEISQINKYYLSKLNKYNLLIKNKNEYLKKIYLNQNLDDRYLDVLDIKISELGYEIYKYREDYINKINESIMKIFKKFNNNDQLLIKYISDFNNMDEVSILKMLKKVRKKEIIQGITSTGVHRDDYCFLFNDQNAKDFCSQGIQKLIALSMKLSESELIKKYYGITPILLLDDLFSELDIVNQNKVLKELGKDNQIFITTTDLENIDAKIIKNSRIINIEKMEEIK